MTMSIQLADSRQSGVFRCSGEQAQALLQQAGAQGFTTAALEIANADRAAVFEGFAAALRFPEWFGANWDALADCLTDLSWLDASGYMLVLRGSAKLAGALAVDDWTALQDVLTEAAEFWRDEGVPFWVLWVEGPARFNTLG